MTEDKNNPLTKEAIDNLSVLDKKILMDTAKHLYMLGISIVKISDFLNIPVEAIQGKARFNDSEWIKLRKKLEADTKDAILHRSLSVKIKLINQINHIMDKMFLKIDFKTINSTTSLKMWIEYAKVLNLLSGGTSENINLMGMEKSENFYKEFWGIK